MLNRIYKVVVAAVLSVLLSVGTASALTLAWNHANPANVAGYTLYFTDAANNTVVYNMSTSEPQITIGDEYFIPGATYVFTVTAYNATGESDYSEELVYTIPDGYTPPANVLPVPGVPLNSPADPETLHLIM